MKRNYLVSPSLIGVRSGAVIWNYLNSSDVQMFDESSPLDVTVDRCNSVSICVWYVSPLIRLTSFSNTSYALLGEMNKWTAVSRQRILSIENQIHNNIALIDVLGVSNETVTIVVFHSVLHSVTVNCHIQPGTD